MDIKSKIREKPTWFSQPESEHIAHMYQSDDELIGSLTEFMRVGIERGEICRVITTATHAAQLEHRLSTVNINVAEVRKSGLYMAYDASETMAKFIVNGMPDQELFAEVTGGLVRTALAANKPIRAFGEMVALLWKAGNQAGVQQLESLWNDLIKDHSISLYCAYPRMHFDKSIHSDILGEINRLHSLVTPEFA